MKLQHIKVNNFRAVRSAEHDLGNQTTYIGYNGSGKSSILLAINWLICGGPLTEKDFYRDPSTNTPADSVSVEGVFTDLTEEDRAEFGKYARSGELKVKRTATVDGGDKLYGNATYHERINQAIEENTFAVAKGTIEKVLQEEGIEFPEGWKNLKKQDLLTLISEWESDPHNSHFLSDAELEDTNKFFGFAGTSLLQSQSGFVFVPAAPDLSMQFSSEVRDSAISTLLGSLVKDTVNRSVETWKLDNSEVLEALDAAISDTSKEDLESCEKSVNGQLVEYLPGIQFNLNMRTDGWVPKISPYVEASITQNGQSFSLESQGHGIQRASLIALLQAVADSRSASSDAGANSSLIVVIEEPEVYQHPVQARQLAAKLSQAASSQRMQLICATHSPFFVSPQHLESTFRVYGSAEGSILKGGTSIGRFADELETGRAAKWFRKTIPEGLFSRACLVLEGDTDQFIFENLELYGTTLTDEGISVLNAEGANNLWTVVNLIESYGIPCYALRDGDSDRDKALRKKNGDQDKAQQTCDTWKSQVNNFVETGISNAHGSGFDDFAWGSGSRVGSGMAVLKDDLEELLSRWSSFMSNCDEESADDLRHSKHAGAYTLALSQASLDDCPEELVSIFDQLLALSKAGTVSRQSTPHQ